jgi:hypothetical protein
MYKKLIRSKIYQVAQFFKILPYINAIRTFKILEYDFGHFISSFYGKPIGNKGQEIPWFTYPAIEYLNRLDLSEKIVFEYGSGNSTIFWSKKTHKVFAVENNVNWFNYLKSKIRKTAYFLETDKDKYINCIAKFKKKYDIIVIDGDYRKECAKLAVNYIKNNGFIILDNSDWFPEISKFLHDNNLIEVSMSGFAPINPYTSTTSFFFNRNINFRIRSTNIPGHIGGVKPN